MTTETPFPQAVAGELRAIMARQQRTLTELAEVLELNRKSAKLRYDGIRSLSLDEVARVSDWLGIDRRVLLGGTPVAVAS